MTQKVMSWLTDEETELYIMKCDELDVPFTQLATLVLVSWVTDTPIPKKKKARKRWVRGHEAITRDEYKNNGTGTGARVEEMMRAMPADSVWSTPQILEGLGWNSSGSLTDILRSDQRFEQTTAPEGFVRKRGKQPLFWKLRTEDGDQA